LRDAAETPSPATYSTATVCGHHDPFNVLFLSDIENDFGGITHLHRNFILDPLPLRALRDGFQVVNRVPSSPLPLLINGEDFTPSTSHVFNRRDYVKENHSRAREFCDLPHLVESELRERRTSSGTRIRLVDCTAYLLGEPSQTSHAERSACRSCKFHGAKNACHRRNTTGVFAETSIGEAERCSELNALNR